MHVMRTGSQENADLVGWGIRVLLLTADRLREAGATARRLSGLGGLVDVETELFAAIETLIEDPRGYGLCVLECDAFGGVERVARTLSLLAGAGTTVPVILLSAECAEQIFPEDRHEPILLRAPVSALALRVGLQHALRDRMAFMAA